MDWFGRHGKPPATLQLSKRPHFTSMAQCDVTISTPVFDIHRPPHHPFREQCLTAATFLICERVALRSGASRNSPHNRSRPFFASLFSRTACHTRAGRFPHCEGWIREQLNNELTRPFKRVSQTAALDCDRTKNPVKWRKLNPKAPVNLRSTCQFNRS